MIEVVLRNIHAIKCVQFNCHMVHDCPGESTEQAGDLAVDGKGARMVTDKNGDAKLYTKGEEFQTLRFRDSTILITRPNMDVSRDCLKRYRPP